MLSIEDLKRTVAKFLPDQFAKLSYWFAAFDGARFDSRIERVAKADKLDSLAAQAQSGKQP